jgi:hypothetical protein
MSAAPTPGHRAPVVQSDPNAESAEFDNQRKEARRKIEARSANHPRIASAMSANPFAVLQCTVRDSSTQIVEAAENRSLVIDPALCTTAKVTLVNTRLRLGAELAWLPGVAPGKAADLLARAEKGMPIMIAVAEKLPHVAACNLLVTTLEASAAHHPDAWLFKDLLMALMQHIDALDAGAELRLINEDRALARFPPVSTGIDEALDECRKQWRQRLRPVLVQSVAAAVGLADAVDRLTEWGAEPAPPFMSEIIGSYAGDMQPQLLRVQKAAQELIASIKGRVKAFEGGHPDFQVDYDQIVEILDCWLKLANPMIVLAQSQGAEDPMTRTFGYELRELVLFLANEHKIYDQARKVSQLIAGQLAFVASLESRMREDDKILAGLEDKQAAAEARERQQAAEYALDTKVGFKRLIIDATTIRYQGKSIPLAGVTHVRYGIHKSYVNGVRTRQNYTVWVGDSQSEIEIECSTFLNFGQEIEGLYELVTNKLWIAVCRRLVNDMLLGLHNDKKYKFRDAVVDRCGITLTRKRLWKVDEPVHCPWGDLSTGTIPGFWVCSRTKDKSLSFKLSFRDDNNTHILAAVLRFLWQDRNHTKLASGTLFK